MTEIKPEAVSFVDEQGAAQTLAVDVMILSVGQHPADAELYQQLIAQGRVCYQVGDAVKPANFRAATRAALDFAYHI